MWPPRGVNGGSSLEIEKVTPEVFAIELGGDPDVLFDRSHLNQVMWNLCRNALRHSRSESRSFRERISQMRKNFCE